MTSQKQKIQQLSIRARDLDQNDKAAFVGHLSGGLMGFANDDSIDESIRNEIVRIYENALKFAEM